MTFRRLEVLLPAADRERFTGRAARRGLTVSTALLTAYAETVGRWSRTSRFTLNVPTVDRPGLHDDIGRLIGDFTSSNSSPSTSALRPPSPSGRRTFRGGSSKTSRTRCSPAPRCSPSSPAGPAPRS